MSWRQGSAERIRKVRNNTGGQCFRAWLLQRSKASEKLTARQVGQATVNLEM